MSRIKDLTGHRFGRLVAVEATEARSRRGEVKWLCACDCGGSTYAVSHRLSSGHIRSCGCLKKEWQSSFGNHTHDLCVKKAEKRISAGQKKCSKCGHVKQMSLFTEKHNVYVLK